MNSVVRKDQVLDDNLVVKKEIQKVEWLVLMTDANMDVLKDVLSVVLLVVDLVVL